MVANTEQEPSLSVPQHTRERQHQFKMKKETARKIDWYPEWCTGAPTPFVYSNGNKVFLTYIIADSESITEDIKTLNETSDDCQENMALVEFDGATFKYGVANDEVLNGLPLYGNGLEFYSAHIIEHSKWLKEIDAIHSVHPGYDPKRREDLRHFMLLFHDELLEVIARTFTVEVFRASMKSMAIEVVKRMNE